MSNRRTANHALQPTPVGAGSSAFAGYVTGPAWLSLGLGRLAYVLPYSLWFSHDSFCAVAHHVRMHHSHSLVAQDQRCCDFDHRSWVRKTGRAIAHSSSLLQRYRDSIVLAYRVERATSVACRDRRGRQSHHPFGRLRVGDLSVRRYQSVR